MLFFSFASSSRLVARGITLQSVSLLDPPKLLDTIAAIFFVVLNLREKVIMKKSSLEKMVQQKKRNKGTFDDKRTRNNDNIKFLITNNIHGSSGPLRFLVNEKDLVSGVIDRALKRYAREERLPVLGFDADNFFLYCANAGFDALNPLEPIGSYGARNFELCKKKSCSTMTEPRSKLICPKSNGGWKAWLKKSFSFKILSHRHIVFI